MSFPTLEELCTSPTAGFAVPATATQRAILRAIEGRPLGELATDPGVIDAFGGAAAVAALPSAPPLEFDLLAGIRTGKSQIAACRALHASQTVDVSGLSAGEVARVSVLSLDLDKADVVLDHLTGTVAARPALRALLVEPPANRTVLLRHPSGRVVEISCVAGARAGGAVVARWSAGAVFDEFPRMHGSSEAVVNFDDARRAVLGRLLPGATLLAIGSPWAPSGPAFERFTERHGRPGPDHVVVRARADAMNPSWWTAARIERMRAQNAQAFATDVRGEFADPSTSFLSPADVRAAVRRDVPLVEPPRDGWQYAAVMDPATRGNAWALIVFGHCLDRDGADRYTVAVSREWRGSAIDPLVVARTLAETKRIIEPYGLRSAWSDQHAADPIRELGERVGLSVRIATIVAGNQPEPVPGARPGSANTVYRSDLYETLAGLFASRAISIPDDRVLIADLLAIRRVTTRTGVGYELPRSADGRHADSAACLALATATAMSYVEERARAARMRHREELERVGELLARAGAYASGDDQRRERAEVRAEILEARFAASRAAPDGQLPAAEAEAWNRHVARGGVDRTERTED